jgi:hypothetical protein
VLNVKILIEMLREVVNELLAPVSNLDLKDTVIPNKPLADNDSSLFSLIALKPNGFKISTFSISVDYNQNNIIPALDFRQSRDEIKAYSSLKGFRKRMRRQETISLISIRLIAAIGVIPLNIIFDGSE